MPSSGSSPTAASSNSPCRWTKWIRRTAELQGRTEELEHQSEGDAERQRVLYADLDERIQEHWKGTLEQAASRTNVMDGGTLAPGELPLPGGSDRDNYQAAFELLKEQRYQEAAIAFEQILGTFPGQPAGGQRAVLARRVALRYRRLRVKR